MKKTEPGPTALGQRVFTAADQQAFAAASHDWNPMHVDPVAARRLLSGRQVVHGMHTVLCALDFWQAGSPAVPRHIACHFASPVNVGDRVVFSQALTDTGKTVLRATVDGLVCTEIEINTDARLSAAPAPPPRAAAALPVRTVAALTSPLDEPAGSQQGQVLRVPAWPTALALAWPNAARTWGPGGLSALARLSYFVGMVCPGQHSVFSSLQLSLPAGPVASDDLCFVVRKYDARFRLFIVAFDGPVSGELRAFLRPPPQPQPRAADLAAHVNRHEFAGRRALVIGGSRGLGEITAKLLAAGGASVCISYAAGQHDAHAVAADIQAQQRGACRVLPLDLRTASFDTLSISPQELDEVYYFATPRIYAKRSALFDRAIFDEFVDFYLQRFYQLCQWLDGAPRSSRLKVYLPSTVFITDRPRGMTEYAMAKAAAEVLADDLNRSLKNVEVLHSRLPRLATDQTAGILALSAQSNLDTLLPIIRAMGSTSAGPPDSQISSAISSL